LLLMTIAPLWVAGCDAELPFGRVLDAAADGEATSPAPFGCALRGPLFTLSDQAPSACGVEAPGFHHALCACEELVNGDTTLVDGFDSRLAPYAPGERSGSLATNRALYLASARIGGSLLIAGPTGTALSGDLAIGGSLLDRGPLQGPWSVTVDGRAEVAGDIRVAALRVAGTLTLAEAAALEVGSEAPAVVRGPVSVAPACSCSESPAPSSAIDAARSDNDNAAIALDPASSLRVFDAASTLALPCGRYFVEAVYAAAPLTLRIEGRVALYVDRNIVVERTGALAIALAEDAELDLFVRQGIAAGGPVDIGMPSAPTRTRVHFGATDSLSFADRAMLAGTLYAPRAELVNQAPFELFGAALLRRVAASGTLALHYDRALDGDACSAAQCTRDPDCPLGLRCDGARCLP
jgi:hypothetical protein